MPFMTPQIDARVTRLAPGFRALSIQVDGATMVDRNVGAQALARACQSVAAGGAPWAQEHLSAWGEVFKRFGAKPQRTPCSALALLKRVQREGSLPCIDPVVDLYNAISIEYAIPVGGEDLTAYEGSPRLIIADGTELFDTMKEGAPAHETPEPGEVVWCDDRGVTCRRWNWRQGTRTRLSAESGQMWFILESLPEMPLAALQEAGDRLIEGLRQMMPGARIESVLIGNPGGA
ncbi:B3/B4 domain-containing protein [Aeromonas media]|uniref:B3/B4 domain-containing protein n=1 Tax=Aeromonas media TaxID=651 RepID=UPI0029D9169B|nr:B3/4 domain-containing protein [Aeromonas media]MDX7900462.1 B3/4 domain-containing protein [Aeromonas media]